MNVPDEHCPRCGATVDGVFIEGPADTVPGVIVVCVYCGAFNVYKEDLTQREMTGAELSEIAASPRLAYFLEIAAQRAVEWRKAYL